MEGENFKLRTEIVLSSAANSVSTSLEFGAFANGPYAKHSRANMLLMPSVFFFCPQPWFLRRSEHTFPEKNTRVNCIGNSRNIESSRGTYFLNSQYLPAIPTLNIAELVPSRFFLSKIIVFVAVRPHLPKENTRTLSIESLWSREKI